MRAPVSVPISLGMNRIHFTCFDVKPLSGFWLGSAPAADMAEPTRASATSPTRILLMGQLPSWCCEADVTPRRLLRSGSGEHLPAGQQAQTAWRSRTPVRLLPYSRACAPAGPTSHSLVHVHKPHRGNGVEAKRRGPERAFRPPSTLRSEVLLALREEDLRWTLEEPCPRNGHRRAARHLARIPTRLPRR